MSARICQYERKQVFTPEMTNFCKGVAVLLLLAHHLIPFHGGGSSFVGQFGQIGKICVAMFVFLSGLGLMRADASSGFRACVNKAFFRLVRLYVNFWIVAFSMLIESLKRGARINDMIKYIERNYKGEKRS